MRVGSLSRPRGQVAEPGDAVQNDGFGSDKALPSVEAQGDLAPFEDLRAHIASTALQVSESRRIAATMLAFAEWAIANPDAYAFVVGFNPRVGPWEGLGIAELVMSELESEFSMDERESTVLADRLLASVHGLILVRTRGGDIPWPTSLAREVKALVSALLPL